VSNRTKLITNPTT